MYYRPPFWGGFNLNSAMIWRRLWETQNQARCLLMTKKKRTGKNRRNFVAIPFEGLITLGTLGSNTVIAEPLLGSNFGEDIFILSVDMLATIRDHTAGETPLVVGLSHSDLTVTEVAEALAAEVTDPDDIIAKERARRPVRRFGVFNSMLNGDMQLGDGKLLRVPVKFSVGDGHDLDIFIVNKSGAALTTGSICVFSGTIFGRWQR